jgi:hypothetical protein
MRIKSIQSLCKKADNRGMGHQFAGLAIALALFSCAPQIPEATAPYFAEFRALAPAANYWGEISFSEDPSAQKGRCATQQLAGPWHITLNKTIFDAISDDGRRVLVFHELTHCALRISEHSPDPGSYMHANPVNANPRENVEAQARRYVGL